MRKHLESCPFCQRRVAELSSDEFLGRLRNAQRSPEMSAANRPRVGDAATDRVAAVAIAIAPPPADSMPPGLAEHRDYEVIRELGARRDGSGVPRPQQAHRASGGAQGRRRAPDRCAGVSDRFLREVQSAAKLQRKNIVAAYSAMRLGESIVLAMEYIVRDAQSADILRRHLRFVSRVLVRRNEAGQACHCLSGGVREMKERREKRKRWVRRGRYAVEVEVDVVYPAGDPSEPCLEPATVRWLDEVARRAEKGDIAYLRSVGEVFRAVPTRTK